MNDMNTAISTFAIAIFHCMQQLPEDDIALLRKSFAESANAAYKYAPNDITIAAGLASDCFDMQGPETFALLTNWEQIMEHAGGELDTWIMIERDGIDAGTEVPSL